MGPAARFEAAEALAPRLPAQEHRVALLGARELHLEGLDVHAAVLEGRLPGHRKALAVHVAEPEQHLRDITY